uniref:Uncharacterized protein n=1 Tax=Caenorhabditis japonica TaxID=281687 RepID=A0A8R1HT80_CAEJA
MYSTPVKRPNVAPLCANDTNDVIRRPAGNRRLSAPIMQNPENRIAPTEITCAPRARRSRRSLEEVVRTIKTPRRHSTQLTSIQLTPRRQSDRPTKDQKTQKKRKSLGCISAPLRPYRTDNRRVIRNPDVVILPLFV